MFGEMREQAIDAGDGVGQFAGGACDAFGKNSKWTVEERGFAQNATEAAGGVGGVCAGE